MRLYEELINKNEALAVVGLGYVGMPLAIAFAKKVNVIGFDINNKKIMEYKRGNDITNEVGRVELKSSTVNFTSRENDLKKAKFFIVAVPTPINRDTTPDLSPVINASKVVGRNLSKGSIVVFESTVYPGVTEEVCVSILEEQSGLKCGVDFKIGYSPERINPGDKVHRIDKIIKIVSGMDEETLDEVASVYELIIKAGVHRAESIKVAEAAKVIENCQRDINIAFMNELSMIFNKMNIDTMSVLKASGTKWNFLKFNPGLVGGHCIGVDPYYLTYSAQQLGFSSQVVMAGRKVNDGMPKFVAENVIKALIKADKTVRNARIGVLGLTFKENCPDIRNSKVINVISELKEYGVEVIVSDPIADIEEINNEYGLEVVDFNKVKQIDVLIIAVNHDEFKKLNLSTLKGLYKEGMPILFDIKAIFDKEEAEKLGYTYWRL